MQACLSQPPPPPTYCTTTSLLPNVLLLSVQQWCATVLTADTTYYQRSELKRGHFTWFCFPRLLHQENKKAMPARVIFVANKNSSHCKIMFVKANVLHLTWLPQSTRSSCVEISQGWKEAWFSLNVLSRFSANYSKPLHLHASLRGMDYTRRQRKRIKPS